MSPHLALLCSPWCRKRSLTRLDFVFWLAKASIGVIFYWFQCSSSVVRKTRAEAVFFGSVKASFGVIMLFLVYGGGQYKGDIVRFCLIKASFDVAMLDLVQWAARPEGKPLYFVARQGLPSLAVSQEASSGRGLPARVLVSDALDSGPMSM